MSAPVATLWPGRSRPMDWAMERAEAGREPVFLSESDLVLLAGRFGPCRVWGEGGQLRIQCQNDPPFLLFPLSRTVFVSQTNDPVRLEFIAGSDGIVSGIVYTDEARQVSRYPKGH